MKKIFLFTILLLGLLFTSSNVLAASGGATTIGNVPTTITKVCPMYSLTTPAQGCYYKSEVNSQGCDIPKLVCVKKQPIDPVKWTCPLNPIKKAPKWCYYKTSIGKNW